MPSPLRRTLFDVLSKRYKPSGWRSVWPRNFIWKWIRSDRTGGNYHYLIRAALTIIFRRVSGIQPRWNRRQQRITQTRNSQLTVARKSSFVVECIIFEVSNTPLRYFRSYMVWPINRAFRENFFNGFAPTADRNRAGCWCNRC